MLNSELADGDLLICYSQERNYTNDIWQEQLLKTKNSTNRSEAK